MLKIWGKESSIVKKPRFYGYKTNIHKFLFASDGVFYYLAALQKPVDKRPLF